MDTGVNSAWILIGLAVACPAVSAIVTWFLHAYFVERRDALDDIRDLRRENGEYRQRIARLEGRLDRMELQRVTDRIRGDRDADRRWQNGESADQSADADTRTGGSGTARDAKGEMTLP